MLTNYTSRGRSRFENGETLVECRDKMLEGFAKVARDTLVAYGFKVPDHDAIEFLEFMDDGITDNLLFREEWSDANEAKHESRKDRATRLWGNALEGGE